MLSIFFLSDIGQHRNRHYLTIGTGSSILFVDFHFIWVIQLLEMSMRALKTFTQKQIQIVNRAAGLAEELVSNAYKLSASEWLRRRYDIKTLADLTPAEIVHGPFAQIIRYQAQRSDTSLSTSSYDFYKICFQDHTILTKLKISSDLYLFPFSLYTVTHELIHIVRFTKFLQNFVATDDEKLDEEMRVHQKTHDILGDIRISGLAPVLAFYRRWQTHHDRLIFQKNLHET